MAEHDLTEGSEPPVEVSWEEINALLHNFYDSSEETTRSEARLFDALLPKIQRLAKYVGPAWLWPASPHANADDLVAEISVHLLAIFRTGGPPARCISSAYIKSMFRSIWANAWRRYPAEAPDNREDDFDDVEPAPSGPSSEDSRRSWREKWELPSEVEEKLRFIFSEKTNGYQDARTHRGRLIVLLFSPFITWGGRGDTGFGSSTDALAKLLRVSPSTIGRHRRWLAEPSRLNIPASEFNRPLAWFLVTWIGTELRLEPPAADTLHPPAVPPLTPILDYPAARELLWLLLRLIQADNVVLRYEYRQRQGPDQDIIIDAHNGYALRISLDPFTDPLSPVGDRVWLWAIEPGSAHAKEVR